MTKPLTPEEEAHLRMALVDTSADTARLREALEAEIGRLTQSHGLHQYDRGIHRMPGCGACEMLARLRAALAEPEPKP